MSVPFRIPALVLFCLLGIGCSAINVQKPSATIDNMTVNGVTSDGFTMNFDVKLGNPNPFPLPLAAADYKLGVSGNNLLSGTAKPEGSVPANGALSVPLTVTLTFENLLVAEQAIQKDGGTIPYDLTGGLTFDTGMPMVGHLRVPLSYSGKLELQDILKNPKAMFGSAAAKKLAAMLLGDFFRK